MEVKCPICKGKLIKQESIIQVMDGNTIYKCDLDSSHKFWRNPRQWEVINLNPNASETNWKYNRRWEIVDKEYEEMDLMIEINLKELMESDNYKQYKTNLDLIGNPGYDMMHNHDGNYGMALDTNFYLHWHKDKFGNYTGRPIKINTKTMDHIHGEGSN